MLLTWIGQQLEQEQQQLAENSEHDLSYADHIEKLEALENHLKSKASKVDPTLGQHLEAIHTVFKGKILKAEKKLLRAEKKRHTEKQKQIESVKDSLFPGGTLQERKDNFLNFYLKDPKFIEKLKEQFDPFRFEMYLITQD